MAGSPPPAVASLGLPPHQSTALHAAQQQAETQLARLRAMLSATSIADRAAPPPIASRYAHVPMHSATASLGAGPGAGMGSLRVEPPSLPPPAFHEAPTGARALPARPRVDVDEAAAHATAAASAALAAHGRRVTRYAARADGGGGGVGTGLAAGGSMAVAPPPPPGVSQLPSAASASAAATAPPHVGRRSPAASDETRRVVTSSLPTATVHMIGLPAAAAPAAGELPRRTERAGAVGGNGEPAAPSPAPRLPLSQIDDAGAYTPGSRARHRMEAVTAGLPAPPHHRPPPVAALVEAGALTTTAPPGRRASDADRQHLERRARRRHSVQSQSSHFDAWSTDADAEAEAEGGADDVALGAPDGDGDHATGSGARVRRGGDAGDGGGTSAPSPSSRASRNVGPGRTADGVGGTSPPPPPPSPFDVAAAGSPVASATTEMVAVVPVALPPASRIAAELHSLALAHVASAAAAPSVAPAMRPSPLATTAAALSRPELSPAAAVAPATATTGAVPYAASDRDRDSVCAPGSTATSSRASSIHHPPLYHLEAVNAANADDDTLRLTRAQLRAHIADAVTRAVAEALATTAHGPSRAASDPAAAPPVAQASSSSSQAAPAGGKAGGTPPSGTRDALTLSSSQMADLEARIVSLMQQLQSLQAEREEMLDELASTYLRFEKASTALAESEGHRDELRRVNASWMQQASAADAERERLIAEIARLNKEAAAAAVARERAVAAARADADARVAEWAKVYEMQISEARSAAAAAASASTAPSPAPAPATSTIAEEEVAERIATAVAAAREKHQQALLDYQREEQRRSEAAVAAALSSAQAAFAEQQRTVIDSTLESTQRVVRAEFEASRTQSVAAAVAAARIEWQLRHESEVAEVRRAGEVAAVAEVERAVESARSEYEAVMREWEASTERWRRQTLEACEASIAASRSAADESTRRADIAEAALASREAQIEVLTTALRRLGHEPPGTAAETAASDKAGRPQSARGSPLAPAAAKKGATPRGTDDGSGGGGRVRAEVGTPRAAQQQARVGPGLRAAATRSPLDRRSPPSPFPPQAEAAAPRSTATPRRGDDRGRGDGGLGSGGSPRPREVGIDFVDEGDLPPGAFAYSSGGSSSGGRGMKAADAGGSESDGAGSPPPTSPRSATPPSPPPHPPPPEPPAAAAVTAPRAHVGINVDADGSGGGIGGRSFVRVVINASDATAAVSGTPPSVHDERAFASPRNAAAAAAYAAATAAAEASDGDGRVRGDVPASQPPRREPVAAGAGGGGSGGTSVSSAPSLGQQQPRGTASSAPPAAAPAPSLSRSQTSAPSQAGAAGESAPGAAPAISHKLHDAIMAMSVPALRSMLEKAGIAFADCVEKTELQQRLLRAVIRGQDVAAAHRQASAAGGSGHPAAAHEAPAQPAAEATPPPAAAARPSAVGRADSPPATSVGGAGSTGGSPASTATAAAASTASPPTDSPGSGVSSSTMSDDRELDATEPASAVTAATAAPAAAAGSKVPSPMELKNWLPAVSADGTRYYYHRITRAVRWERPEVEAARSIEARIAEEHAAMKARQAERLAALAADEARAKSEASRRAVMEAEIEGRVSRWARGKTIRSMLSTLASFAAADRPEPLVVVPDAIATLAASASAEDVKKAYLRAVRLVHPDKMASASLEVQLEAARVFTVLSDAFQRHVAGGDRGAVPMRGMPATGGVGAAGSAANVMAHAAARARAAFTAMHAARAAAAAASMATGLGGHGSVPPFGSRAPEPGASFRFAAGAAGGGIGGGIGGVRFTASEGGSAGQGPSWRVSSGGPTFGGSGGGR